jgi:hypothetical protein
MYDEDLEQELARLVASLSPEEYERRGPALRELGLALAEARQIDRQVQRLEEDQARAMERVRNAFRLLEDDGL